LLQLTTRSGRASLPLRPELVTMVAALIQPQKLNDSLPNGMRIVSRSRANWVPSPVPFSP
jgi:hypothetical protein